MYAKDLAWVSIDDPATAAFQGVLEGQAMRVV